MAVYLISYDLKKAALYNYLDMHSKIQSFGLSIKILESTFLVDTNLSAQSMSDQIKSVYQPEKHFVIRLQAGDYQGVIANAYWPWIQARL